MLKKITAATLCAVLLCLSGCGTKTQETSAESVELYFLSADGNSMVTERRSVPQGEEDKISFAVNGLIKGPAQSEHKRAIPQETTLIDVKCEGSVATVNLSAQFDTGEDMAKVWSRYTLINTVCSLEGISKTQILVEGKKVNSVSTGEPLGEMGKDDIVTDTSQITDDTVVVTLYFSDSNAMYLVPESRQVTVKEGEKLENMILEELIKGPENHENGAVLSNEIKVLSTETKDGVCFVNLSQEFISKAPGGSTWEMLAVYSIVNTLCGLDKIDKVQILVEGKKTEGFGHMDLSQPCEPDNKILNV